MAEGQDDNQERTEQPTPKRLQESRDKGQVPRSKELTMTMVMLVGSGTLLVSGRWFSDQFEALLTQGFRIDRAAIFDDGFMARQFVDLAVGAFLVLAPFMLALTVAALAAPALIGGWIFSGQAMAPKLSRLDPIKGLKRVFGAQGLMELLKAMGKFLLVGAAAGFFLWLIMDRFLSLSRLPIVPAIADSVWLAGLALFVASAALLVIAAIDVPFQVATHNKQLRMTRQEVRDELKQTEGRPEVKGRIRSLQQEMASRRMMNAVPDADIVITNPTHFAVALRFDATKMAAPEVVAKGAELVALAIRRVAEESGVPLLEAPPLARALYRSVDIGDAIPADLYVAVAEVLAWVHQVRTRPANAPAPPAPNPEVDEADPGTP
ncbi:MAG: flagellar biosynthesis protein FlhB [Chromatocurvus sp.]